MAKNKTVETKASVAGYLKNIQDENRKKDCSEMVALLTEQTGLEPKMWGPGIVGFGSYHYKYESGREGDAPLIGMSSRANAIVLYLCGNFDKREELLKVLG